MTDYMPENPTGDSIEETRRKKLEEFFRSYDHQAMSGEYDAQEDGFTVEQSAPQSVHAAYVPGVQHASSEPGSSVSYSTDDTPLKPRRKEAEINSFSNSDAKKRIERDSKKALKQQKKEEKRIEKSKAKRNRRVFKWVWLTMIAMIAVMIAQYVIIGMNDMLAVNRSDNVRTVTISVPAQPTIDTIADILYDNGVIARPTFFKLYTRITSSESGFRQGEFKLNTDKDYEAIVNTLQSNVSRTDIVSVQITEGMSIWEIVKLLHTEGVTSDVDKFLALCNSDTFDEDHPYLKDVNVGEVRKLSADGHTYYDAYKLEGYLFPDTYHFYLNEDPVLTIDKLLNNYEAKVLQHKEKYFGHTKKSTLEQEAAQSGYTLHEILTIASIIQAEAADKDDMYTISSILRNRLEYGGAYGVAKLNCDCTVHYPWRSVSEIPEALRTDYVSRYDTNTFNGLPPGPICNPGTEAIKAALNPYSTDYLYFCHDTVENGSTAYYASTLEGHEENLARIG